MVIIIHSILVKYSIPIIPIRCQLPSLQNPLSNMISETLMTHYQFSAARVSELKLQVQGHGGPPSFRLLLILDSYDELIPSVLGKNLYDWND
jgi:hypothetical protein